MYSWGRLMRLTTKGRYAVTAMLDLAIHQDQGTVALSEVAARQGLSLSYLEQLFAQLRRRGLVSSTRGPGGGYALARMPHQISVAQVIDAIDENIDATLCRGSKDCSAHSACLTHYLWADLSDHIRRFLADITLANLVDQPHVQEVAMRQDKRQEVFFVHSVS